MRERDEEEDAVCAGSAHTCALSLTHTQEELRALEKTLREQEVLIAAYQKENEKLLADRKAAQVPPPPLVLLFLWPLSPLIFSLLAIVFSALLFFFRPLL